MTKRPSINGQFLVHADYNCIDSYVLPHESDIDTWSDCPCCGLKPRNWCFNNGRSTACGCWNSCYDHFAIHAESVVSVHNRTGKTVEYDHDGLRKNWNHWCATGEVLFEHAGKRDDGRW